MDVKKEEDKIQQETEPMQNKNNNEHEGKNMKIEEELETVEITEQPQTLSDVPDEAEEQRKKSSPKA